MTTWCFVPIDKEKCLHTLFVNFRTACCIGKASQGAEFLDRYLIIWHVSGNDPEIKHLRVESVLSSDTIQIKTSANPKGSAEDTTGLYSYSCLNQDHKAFMCQWPLIGFRF